MISTYSSYGFMEEVNRLFASVSAGVDFSELIAEQGALAISTYAPLYQCGPATQTITDD